MSVDENYEVVIAGGGPAGLSAALGLGRACRRVLLCDAGPRRNAAADAVHNFVTRDGVAPDEFRRLAREQLAAYANVDVRDTRIEAIDGSLGAFEIRLAAGSVRAARVLLCTGMIDELPDIEGFRTLWGRSIFICPYCHGWESRGRRFAYLAPSIETLDFAIFLQAWTRDVIALTDGRFPVPADVRARLVDAGVGLDVRPIARLVSDGQQLTGIAFSGEEAIARDVLFAHPPQRQVDLVQRLGLALDAKGYVQVDGMRRETSRPGIHAAGDLITPAQSAVFSAASGMQAAAGLTHALTMPLEPTR